jgi:hypothetical protein
MSPEHRVYESNQIGSVLSPLALSDSTSTSPATIALCTSNPTKWNSPTNKAIKEAFGQIGHAWCAPYSCEFCFHYIPSALYPRPRPYFLPHSRPVVERKYLLLTSIRASFIRRSSTSSSLSSANNTGHTDMCWISNKLPAVLFCYKLLKPRIGYLLES